MRTKVDFIKDWMESESETSESKSLRDAEPGKDFHGSGKFYIFVDMDYFGLLSQVGWEAAPNAYGRRAITVPFEFVTDFASVPRPFWSLLPPIGRYGYAALFHDYVYWQQEMSRAEADDVFRDTMRELGVPGWKMAILFSAVRLFGDLAWRNNAALKASGERRTLKSFPDNITTSWKVWKRDPRAYD